MGRDIHILGRAGVSMKCQCDGADHRRRGPCFAQGMHDRLGNRQGAFGPIASFRHVCRPGRSRASGVEGAGRETAQVVLARSEPASMFVRYAACAPHRSICSCAGRRVRRPCAGCSFRPSRGMPNMGSVAYPFRKPDAAGVTGLEPEDRLVLLASAEQDQTTGRRRFRCAQWPSEAA